MPTVEELVYNMILFMFLPLWVLFGGMDYWCHRYEQSTPWHKKRPPMKSA